MPDIFSTRERIKPYQYPQFIPFAKAIQHSFWEIDEFDFDKDVIDFKSKLTTNEQSVIEKSMLAINLVENKVKSFWGRLEMRIQPPEVAFAGATCSGNEVVHFFAYSELLSKLNLEERFEKALEIPCMKDRVAYLNKYLQGVNSRSNKEFTKSLILFTLLVENVSLFSQFLIISSFGKYKNLMKNFSTVINATARDEILHGKLGAELIKVIRRENPEWFDQEMEDKIRRAIRKAYRAELKVLDWIFEEGELDHISKEEVVEYLKFRLNDSLRLMGYKEEYEVNEVLLDKAEYLEVMITATKDFDFFDSRTTDYSKGKSFTEDSLW